MVFDNLPSDRFTFRAKEQIGSICCCKGKVVAVIKNVQNQRGASDCGYFHLRLPPHSVSEIILRKFSTIKSSYVSM